MSAADTQVLLPIDESTSTPHAFTTLLTKKHNHNNSSIVANRKLLSIILFGVFAVFLLSIGFYVKIYHHHGRHGHGHSLAHHRQFTEADIAGEEASSRASLLQPHPHPQMQPHTQLLADADYSTVSASTISTSVSHGDYVLIRSFYGGLLHDRDTFEESVSGVNYYGVDAIGSDFHDKFVWLAIQGSSLSSYWGTGGTFVFQNVGSGRYLITSPSSNRVYTTAATAAHYLPNMYFTVTGQYYCGYATDTSSPAYHKAYAWLRAAGGSNGRQCPFISQDAVIGDTCYATTVDAKTLCGSYCGSYFTFEKLN